MDSPLATLADLRKRWKDLPDDLVEDADQGLIDASLEVRGRFQDIDRRISEGTISRDVVVMVVCRMVKRALEPTPATDNAPQNATQLSFTAGPFGQSFSLKPNDGAIFLSKADIRLLSPDEGSGQIFGFIPR